MGSNPVVTVDVLIVGGGLTGALLMIALANKGHRCLLINTASSPTNAATKTEPRALALSMASIRVLTTLNVWPSVAPYATPMRFIHVSEQGGFGATRLSGTEALPLGYVVEMQQLQDEVNALLPEEACLHGVDILACDPQKGMLKITHAGQIRIFVAKLIVGADGSDSPLRQLNGLSAVTHPYHQYALVANVGLARDHENCAYERFMPSGPLAFLPMKDKMVALIWNLPKEDAERLQHLKPTLFLSELQKTFGYRLGRFLTVGKRSIFPLKQVKMPATVSFPLVFIGNAAQTLHPIAGQGFNLGLRDVATLAQCILSEGLSPEMLATYQGMRATDQSMVLSGTHYLLKLFMPRFKGIKVARQLGLMLFDLLPSLKETFVQYASGLGKLTFDGMAPDLICGRELSPSTSTSETCMKTPEAPA